MTMSEDLTVEQAEGAIVNALKAGDMKAVEAFLYYIALKDPERAELIMAGMKVGLALKKEARDD